MTEIDYQPFVEDTIEALRNLSEESGIPFATKSYPSMMEILGVNLANTKLVLKELNIQTLSFEPYQKIELAKRLAYTNIFECHYLSFEYIAKDKKVLASLTAKDIDDFCVNMDNWVSVDCYGLYFVGYAYREGIIDINRLKEFYSSDDFWIRRIPIVSTVTLNQKSRGGKGDPERTLEICSWAIDDHKDLINKAMSWALRELVKRQKEPVIEFLEKHSDRLHSRILKEVWNKILTGRKTV